MGTIKITKVQSNNNEGKGKDTRLRKVSHCPLCGQRAERSGDLYYCDACGVEFDVNGSLAI